MTCNRHFWSSIDFNIITDVSSKLSDLSKAFAKVGDLQRAELLLQEAVDMELSSSELQACWGGHLNGQVGRAEIVKYIIKTMKPMAIVETGSFRGVTTEWFAKEFKLPVFSCEVEPLYFRQSRARLNNLENVNLLEMNSIHFLEKIIMEFNLDNTFFYLDAHWLKILPLRQEMKLIFMQSRRAVIMIDDFCVPDDPGYGWDDFGPDQQLQLKILWGLIPENYEILFPTLKSDKETGARRGCCVIAPTQLFQNSSILRAGTFEDWLRLQLDKNEETQKQYAASSMNADIIIQSLRYDLSRSADAFDLKLSTLNEQMLEKENVLQEIARANEAQRTLIEQFDDNLVEKEKVIQELAAATVAQRTLIEQLNKQLIEKDSTIQDLAKLGHEDHSTINRLNGELVQKETVIRELADACTEYRKAEKLKRNVLKNGTFRSDILQARLTKSTGKALDRFGKILISPIRPRIKLGVLYQHSPREIRLPRYGETIRSETLPKISIVTPSFRHGRYIETTIMSVLKQNYRELEYVIQDGGSTDGTCEVLKKYESQLASWRSEPDSGQADAINRGFARTTGEIMAWLNSDDILLPGALARVADYFIKHHDVDVIYGDRILIDGNGQQIGRWMLPGHDGDILSWADYIPQETLFWRRRIWEKVGGTIDASFQFAMDWDLLIRFRDVGAKFNHVPQFLGAFRIQSEQKTIAQIGTIGAEEMNLIRSRIHGYVPNHKDIKLHIKRFLKSHARRDMHYSIAEFFLQKFWNKV